MAAALNENKSKDVSAFVLSNLSVILEYFGRDGPVLHKIHLPVLTPLFKLVFPSLFYSREPLHKLPVK